MKCLGISKVNKFLQRMGIESVAHMSFVGVENCGRCIEEHRTKIKICSALLVVTNIKVGKESMMTKEYRSF